MESAVSVGAAWAAHSPALLGFGGDSAVELLSALVVLDERYLDVVIPGEFLIQLHCDGQPRKASAENEYPL